MTSGSVFLCKMSLLRRKVHRRDVTRYMSRISVHRVSLNILLANFDRFSDPSCWAGTFSAQDAGFIPSYDVIFLYYMICYSEFVLLFIDRLLPLPCKLCFVLLLDFISMLIQPGDKRSRFSNIDLVTVLACRGLCTHTHSLLPSELYPFREPGFSSVSCVMCGLQTTLAL